MAYAWPRHCGGSGPCGAISPRGAPGWALLDRPDAAEPTTVRAYALFGAGVLARIQGDFVAADALLDEALSIARAIGDDGRAADVLAELGDVADGRAAYDRARSLLEQSLVIRRRLGDSLEITNTLSRLTRVALRQRDHVGASRSLTELQALGREINAQDYVAAADFYAGELASQIGDWDAARARYAASLALFHELGYQRWIARALEGLATLAPPERAIRLAGAASALREASGQPLSPSERAHLEERLALPRLGADGTAADSPWDTGRRAPLAQIVSEALALADPVAHA
jgi:tetratricopeptide (TPR) repeat protein